MKPLGPTQWAGILFACGCAVLTVYIATLSIALVDAQYAIQQPMPLQWLLLAGAVGILAGGTWVQLTWQPQQATIQQGRTKHG